MGSKFFVVLLLVMLSSASIADVVNPGHINRQFMFTNLDKFPAFTYYFLHYNYYYELGWKRSPADTQLIESNHRYAVSSKGNDKTPLLVKDKNGRYFISAIKIGGSGFAGESVKGIVDVYTITSIRSGIIKIKKEKEIVQYNNGEEKERKSSKSFAAFFGSDGFTSGLALTSTVALAGLLFLFILKKKKPKYIQLTS